MPNSGSWFCYVRRSGGAALRLFCLPHAGGDAVMFSPWRDGLPPEVEVWPLQPPGRGVRMADPPYRSIGPFADELSTALEPWLDLPFAIFGHSLGAKVGFEVARRLQKRFRAVPLRLFVSAHPAPHLPLSHEPVYTQPHPEFLRSLRGLGTPPAVLENPDLLAIFEPVLRADFEACETYRFEPDEPLACAITALGGVEDPYVSRTGLEAWHHHTSGAHCVRMFPGGHFFVNSARPLVLSAIALDLADSQKGGLANVRRREGRHDDLYGGCEP